MVKREWLLTASYVGIVVGVAAMGYGLGLAEGASSVRTHTRVMLFDMHHSFGPYFGRCRQVSADHIACAVDQQGEVIGGL